MGMQAKSKPPKRRPISAKAGQTGRPSSVVAPRGTVRGKGRSSKCISSYRIDLKLTTLVARVAAEPDTSAGGRSDSPARPECVVALQKATGRSTFSLYIVVRVERPTSCTPRPVNWSEQAGSDRMPPNAGKRGLTCWQGVAVIFR